MWTTLLKAGNIPWEGPSAVLEEVPFRTVSQFISCPEKHGSPRIMLTMNAKIDWTHSMWLDVEIILSNCVHLILPMALEMVLWLLGFKLPTVPELANNGTCIQTQLCYQSVIIPSLLLSLCSWVKGTVSGIFRSNSWVAEHSQYFWQMQRSFFSLREPWALKTRPQLSLAAQYSICTESSLGICGGWFQEPSPLKIPRFSDA